MYSEVVMLIITLAEGPILDMIGRKIPVLTGYVLAGIALILMPDFKSIFPSLFILRIFA